MDDLISRRKLLVNLCCDSTCNYLNGNRKVTQSNVRHAILNQPAEDAEIVKHGHWVSMKAPTWEGHHWYCSCCEGHIVTRYPEYPEDKWCKNCGAKMDEEV